jgi:hypothetical protein
MNKLYVRVWGKREREKCEVLKLNSERRKMNEKKILTWKVALCLALAFYRK